MECQKGESKTKVLYIILSMCVGGAEKLVYDMILNGNKSGFTPLLCCLDEIGSLGEDLSKRGVKIYFRKRKKSIDFGLVKWLSEIISTEKIDVVHAHQYTPYFYAVSAKIFKNKVKLIYTEHGRLFPDARNLKRYLFNPLFALRTDHIVSISECTKKAMVKYDNFPENKIQVILNGAKIKKTRSNLNLIEKRKSIGITDSSQIVGMAARIDKIKNISMALHAFKKVLTENPETYLVIAGKGPMEGELKLEAEQLNISHRVKFLGLRTDLDELYRIFDVFVLSSFTEGISITLIEAMSNAIPVVVTDVGGNPEVVINEKTGFLVPLDDIVLMSHRIVEFLNDIEKSSKIGARAEKRVRDYFDFEKMLSRTVDLYKS